MTTRKVHVIFKTHLDVGFTDFAANVVTNYFESYIPAAMRVARTLRESGRPERFVWTTGAWLIYEFLEQASPVARAEMEAAIAAGDIVWHGLPFTTHSELMDADLFRFGLSLSQSLDRRYGRHTIAAKMTDVPGHTRAIIPLLAEAGIQFLHIGVNAASTAPAVPLVFTWRHSSGAEVVVMYHKGSYGDLMEVPGLDEAIYFAHTGDNLGPQSPEEIQEVFAALRRRVPQAEPVASTMDAYARALMTVRNTLPVVTGELGDTWIHGAGSDPQKTAAYRALLRLRNAWLADGSVTASDAMLHAFDRKLFLVPEHTWGLDVKTHLADWKAWNGAGFTAARSEPNFQKMEASWAEQRGYVHSAIAALGKSPLAAQANAAVAATLPTPPATSGMQTVPSGSTRLSTSRFEIGFDARTGAINHLAEHGRKASWATPQHPLALFRYQSFSQADYDRYYREYVQKDEAIAWWAIPDFLKPGIEESDAQSGFWLPQLQNIHQAVDAAGTRIVLDLAGDPIAHRRFGCPGRITVELRLPHESPKVDVTLQWFDKPACRLPEALWYSFTPNVTEPDGWKLDKMGDWISPLDVIADGNKRLHGVGSGVKHTGRLGEFTISSLDAALVAPGEPALLRLHNRRPPLTGGMHYLLFNNLWGTNFTMWSGENARFRFAVSPTPTPPKRNGP